MRSNWAEELVNAYLYRRTYFNKANSIKLDEDNRVYDRNTIMAYFWESPDYYDDEGGLRACEFNLGPFMIVTLQNFKSQSSWKTHKEKLIKAAIDAGIFVIFVKEIDMFEGEPINDAAIYYKPTHPEDYVSILKYLLTFTFKDAGCLVAPGFGINEDTLVGCAVPQHGYTPTEILLCYYASQDEKIKSNYVNIITIKELNSSDIRYCIHDNVSRLNFVISQPEDYSNKSQLLNDIWSQQITVNDGVPIKWNKLKINNKLLEKIRSMI